MTWIEKNKFHYFLLYLKIKKKKFTLSRWPWILLGSWMSVQWQKIMCWFSSYTKKTKTKTKTFFHRCLNETNWKQKNMFLKVPSVPKGRGWGSSMFFFWTELCKQSILRASNSVNSLTNNWILRKFRTLKAELERWSLKFSLVLLRSAY